MRTIQNCKPQNAVCHTPGPFSLVRPKDILDILSMFVQPYVAACDGKSWFHQLGLDACPPELPRAFSLFCNGKTYESRTWPMGAAHVPIMGNVANMIGMLATRSEKYTFHSPDARPGVPPAYVIVRDKRSHKPVAALISFLDNTVSVSISHAARLVYPLNLN